MEELDKLSQYINESTKGLISKSKSDVIYDAIVKLIEDGTFKKGVALPSEFELAKSLNVGRSTIREAVKKLVSQNILEIKRGQGTYISELPGVLSDPFGFRFNSNKIQLGIDLCEIRLMIEPTLAYQAALKATPKQIAEMEKYHNEVADLISHGKNHELADIEFHTSIANCSTNTVLKSMMQVIYEAIKYIIDITDRSLCNEAVEVHAMILDAIKNKDPQSAHSAMVLHISQNKQALLKKL